MGGTTLEAPKAPRIEKREKGGRGEERREGVPIQIKIFHYTIGLGLGFEVRVGVKVRELTLTSDLDPG